MIQKKYTQNEKYSLNINKEIVIKKIRPMQKRWTKNEFVWRSIDKSSTEFISLKMQIFLSKILMVLWRFYQFSLNCLSRKWDTMGEKNNINLIITKCVLIRVYRLKGIEKTQKHLINNGIRMKYKLILNLIIFFVHSIVSALSCVFLFCFKYV